MAPEHLLWAEAKEEVSEVEVSEVEEAVGEVVAQGTSAFSFRGDNAISVKAVNSHMIVPELVVVEAVSEEAKHLLHHGFLHMEVKEEVDTSSHKEAKEGTASLWAEVVVTLNKEVLLVTVSQVVTEVKEVSLVHTVARALSQVVTVDRAVSQRAMVASQVVTEDSKVVTEVGVANQVATAEAVIVKDQRVATLSQCQVVDITRRQTRRPLEDTDSRAVIHSKEAAGQVTHHPRAFIANHLEVIQEAEPMRHREEVHLVAMERQPEEEDVEGDIPNTEETHFLGIYFYHLSSPFLW